MNDHVSVFIEEEMNARHWDDYDLAIAMGGDPLKNLLCWRLIKIVGPDRPNLKLGSSAEKFSKAFDVSEEFLLNLEQQWLEGAV